jgi:putative ABC transport system substrate-binding protein
MAPTVHAATIAVIYPETSGAYSQVFESIIAGVQQTPGVRVLPRALASAVQGDEVQAWLNGERPDAVIALGQRGYNIAKGLAADTPVVVGATLMAPDGVSGISLTADPEQFLRRLGELTPRVKRVFVVYSEKHNGWLVRRAERLAERYGIQLLASEAADMRTAVKNYLDVLDAVREQQDAIWLPLDIVAPDKTVLPLILEAACKKRLVVFSDNPSHAEKGALFSLYPDHEGMGRRLANMALGMVQNGRTEPGVEPLRDLKIAVNLRTASHLGMLYTPGQERDFALVFPSR